MVSDRLKEVAPHYLAMFALAFLVPAVARNLVGDLGFWVELALVFAVFFVYRAAVMSLGVGPSAWEE